MEFVDWDSGDDAGILLRRFENGIAIHMSLKSNGDIDVAMSHDEAARLGQAILAAASASMEGTKLPGPMGDT
jgi:hypothetical protein